MKADDAMNEEKWGEFEGETEGMQSEGGGIPSDWKEAIPSLISSRIAIAQMELKDAMGAAIGKIITVVVALFLLLLCWLLVLVGLIGLIAAKSGWEWYAVMFAAAGVHAVAAMIALACFKAKKTVSVFPVTKAEFEKDVEWLKELKREQS
jgi:uncharacterized membrane protein YqjE